MGDFSNVYDFFFIRWHKKIPFLHFIGKSSYKFDFSPLLHSTLEMDNFKVRRVFFVYTSVYLHLKKLW